MTCDVASDRYVGNEAPNLLLEKELEKSDSEGRIRAKLAGSCLTAAVYFIIIYIYIYFTCSQSVHQHTEIDMVVFEAPL